MSVLILIPAYNEADSIRGVLTDLRREVPEFDRLVVSDGSTDGTADVVAAMGERVLRLPCNLGYGPALQTGLRYALAREYEIVVFLDADGQHRPEDVPALVGAIRDGKTDLVIGSRFSAGRGYDGPLGRRIGMYLFSRFSRLLLGRRIYDTTSGFKAINARVAKTLLRATLNDFHTEALVRLALRGYSIAEVPVSMPERQHGKSMHSTFSALAYPLKTFVLTVVAVVDALVEGRNEK